MLMSANALPLLRRSTGPFLAFGIVIGLFLVSGCTTADSPAEEEGPGPLVTSQSTGSVAVDKEETNASEQEVAPSSAESLPETDAAKGDGTGDSGAVQDPPEESVEPETKPKPKPKPIDPGLGRPGGKTLPHSAIKATIKRNIPQVRACYERALKQEPGLEGKVVVAWTIGADGRVRKPRVVGNSTKNRRFLPCITRAVASWSFPKAQSPSDIQYPFVFRPSTDWR